MKYAKFIVGTLSIILILTLFGCKSQTPNELLIEELETFFAKDVVPKMNDPKSYEKIDSEITDTVMFTDIINGRINTHKESKEFKNKQYTSLKNTNDQLRHSDGKLEELMKSFKESMNLDSLKIDSLNIVLKNTPTNEMDHVILQHNFRSKNGFGALVLGKYTFSYYPKEKDLAKRFLMVSDK